MRLEQSTNSTVEDKDFYDLHQKAHRCVPIKELGYLNKGG